MYIHIRNQEIDCVCVRVCVRACVRACVCVCVVIYNKLLLNHLWSCVLKLISELHDLSWDSIPERERERKKEEEEEENGR